MRLTRASEYAIRSVIFLSSQGQGKLVKRKDIAEAMEVPAQFLSKIAQNLAKSGIIEIIQGARGGFRLIAEPEKLTLLDVVEAEIGEIFLNDCIIKPDSCRRSAICAVHKVWQKAREQLRNTLKEVTFSDLLREETCLDIFLQPQPD